MSHSPLSAIALVCAIGSAFLMPSAGAQAIISELLADNRSGLTDSDGDASDWIEIHNDSATPLNLEGWRLTDNALDTSRWVFPAVTMQPRTFLIVFASGKDRRDPAAELHTNFSLSNNGEYLALIAPLGDVASELTFPAQMEDISYGRSINVQSDVVLPEGASCRWLVPTGPTPGWETSAFNDAAWSTGTTGIAYDTGTFYDTLTGTDVQNEMFNVNGSVYMRMPFTVTNAEELQSMTLNVRYDDGFIAFINGIEVGSASIPANVQWNSLATVQHIDSEAVTPQPFDAAAALPSIVNGQNTLAIQLLNATLNSSDLLLMPEVVASSPDPNAIESIGFMLEPSPGAKNNNASEGFVADTKFSVKRGFYESPINVEITSLTEGASIRYTINGTAPSDTEGTLYTGPVNITTTTILRAIAFKENFVSTNIDTQTYIFPAAVKAHADMDTDIVTNPSYANTIEDDLSDNLPTMSLVVANADFFGSAGIYSNPNNSGPGAEVPLSVEFFDPSDPADEFQIDAGIRIHGGNARSHPKKPMRLYFRGEYGARRLNHPLFEGSPVESFDQLILRGGGHDSWSLAQAFGRDPDEDIPPHGVIMRDQFLRKTETEMGLLSPRGRYIHLYINARYWGVYDVHERVNADYFESHLGGDETDYDVLHHPEFTNQDYVVVDGTATAWEDARSIAAAGITTEAQYLALQEFIDIDNLIDHLIVRMWSGDYDWCGPISRPTGDVTIFSSKNWYTGRRSRGDSPGQFKFFCWDAEMSMGNHLLVNLGGGAPDQRVLDFDLTGANDSGTPVQFYAALRNYPEFRQRFGDRLQKHLFNDGKMSPAANRSRWDKMWQSLRSPMVAESARWGDEGFGVSTPFERNTTWLGEVFWIRNSFISGRNTTLLDQFKNRGLYPDVDAPVFSQHGGSVPSNFQLSMTSAGNDIFYTTDGSEPVVPQQFETVELLAEVAPASALVPSVANGGSALTIAQWTNLTPPANIASWLSGQTGVGYETAGTNYQPLINLDVTAASGENPGVYVRIPFEVEEGTNIDSFAELTLSMKYDDGFIAYLNGVRVAASNGLTNPAWNSAATGNRPDNQAIVFQDFDIGAFTSALVVGDNILALHALNDSATSSDLLCRPRLTASIDLSDGGGGPTAQLYTGSITLDASANIRARAIAPDGTVSALTEATFLVGTLAAANNLVISEINYHPLPPTTPAEMLAAASDTDFEFIELQNIGNTAIDLTGCSFSQGIDFAFEFGDPLTLLQPGEYALLVENRGAFTARYGSAAAARIAGKFKSDSKLSNNGETLTLLASNGNVIKTLTYTDSAPWPTSADGDGSTLHLVTPSTNPDHNDPASWQATRISGGTPAGFTIPDGAYSTWAATAFAALPGADTSPGADPDNDGWSNLAEYALASSPASPDSVPSIEVFLADIAGTEYLAMRYTTNADASDVTIAGQTSVDLATWTANTTELDPPVGQVHTLRATSPASASPRRQLRLSITLAP